MITFDLDCLEQEIECSDFLASLDEKDHLQELIKKNNIDLNIVEINSMFVNDIFDNIY